MRKKNIANIAADDEQPRQVRARALTAREQPQRRDRLLGAALDRDEARQQHHRRANEAIVPALPQPFEAARTNP